MTSLIDVMMSLLAIFMITAPVLTSSMKLDLPKGDGKTVQEEIQILDLSVDKSGQIFIGQEKADWNQILPKISAILNANPKIQIMISGDKNASYGTVVELMGMIRNAGFNQVGLKTDIQAMTPKQSRE